MRKKWLYADPTKVPIVICTKLTSSMMVSVGHKQWEPHPPIIFVSAGFQGQCQHLHLDGRYFIKLWIVGVVQGKLVLNRIFFYSQHVTSKFSWFESSAVSPRGRPIIDLTVFDIVWSMFELVEKPPLWSWWSTFIRTTSYFQDHLQSWRKLFFIKFSIIFKLNMSPIFFHYTDFFFMEYLNFLDILTCAQLSCTCDWVMKNYPPYQEALPKTKNVS